MDGMKNSEFTITDFSRERCYALFVLLKLTPLMMEQKFLSRF
jgi:hypothetical protein